MPELIKPDYPESTAPSGTVTFLFTDIEGSTKLLERLRDQYATLLEEQRELLRAIFARWNGHEMDTQGDAFFVAFPRALDAVNCVVEAQRQIAAHEWHRQVKLLVRMGLHTGEPIVARTGYVGMDVHRAARITATGHGGQVLLSQTTRDLVFTDLPEGVRLRSLGAHKLKDILYPQEIYQLDISGLNTDFPPLKSLEKLDKEDIPPAPGEAPYKGLQYFDERDSPWFYGRQAVTARLVEAIRTGPFLAVIGASGSGKSSVVRAGMIPALRQDNLVDWWIHVITPTAHPLEALAVSLTRRIESITATATLIDDLQSDRRSLHLFAQKQISSHPQGGGKSTRLLLLVDQFEELFTLCRSENERQAFIDNLLTAVGTQGSQVTIVITLRADFYERLAQYSELRELVASHQVYIGAMNAAELREAIEQPALHGGWEMAPGLVELMLHDIGAWDERTPEPGALPLLSHALLETWNRRRGSFMSLKSYTEAGGVHRAIAQTADRVFKKELDAAQQQIARNIFLRLTELGEGTQDTRRRISIHELIPPGPAGDAEQIQAVLVRLADARLITTSEGTVEVAHEALIREWPALQEWLAQDREGLRLHRHLTEAAQEWELLDRDPGALYRGARLAQAVEWALANPRALNAQEQAYLEASSQAADREQAEREDQRLRELEAAQRLAESEKLRAESETRRADENARSAKRLRRRAISFAIVMIVALAFAGGATYFFNQASRNARLATSRELAAGAMNSLQSDPELSALLALLALDQTYTREAENALHASLPAMHLLKNIPLEMVVETLALSPDGNLLAAGEGMGAVGARIKLIDPDTAQVIREIKTGQRDIFGLAFSPDGSRLASVDWDGDVNIWTVASGDLELEFHAHDGGASRVAFSPDGARLATGGDDATAKIWDSSTGELLLTLSGHAPAARAGSLHPGGVIEVAFTPDGERLVTGGADGSARLWDATSGEELQAYSGHTNEIYIGLSPDGTRLATAGQDGFIKIWDITSASTVAQPLVLINHEQPARALAFSPDGASIAVASQDGAARAWAASSGVRRFSLVGHTGDLDDLVFSADGARLYTGSADKTVKIWDLAPGREVMTFPGDGGIFSPDGKKMAVVIGTGMQIRDTTSWDVLAELPISEQPFIIRAAFSPDGKYIATCSWAGTAHIWDAVTGQEISNLVGHTDRIWMVAFSPDSKRLVTASADKTARVWDVISGQELLVLNGHSDVIQAVDFSPHGQTIATASWDHTVRLWDAFTGAEKEVLAAEETPLSALDYSPDGTHLAAGNNEGDAFVWDLSNGKSALLHRIAAHTASIVYISFSPDGKYLATPGFDGMLKVWRIDTGEDWLTFDVGVTLTDVAFDPSSQRLSTGGFEHLTRVFDLDLEETKKRAERRLTRSLTDAECQRYLHQPACE